MNPLHVIALSGSLRTGSYNRRALQLAKKIAAEWGAEVKKIDLRELNIPIYDGDIETAGLPDSVKQLKASIEAAHVLLIASPEYNHSIPGVLKNAIDWLSRGGNSLKGKYAAIFGASDGSLIDEKLSGQLKTLATATLAMAQTHLSTQQI